ncbi:MAG: PfkB family carbohydrate kinase [Anaerostipes sp.]|nr:PfkB family carbohydrate kinase [Anaerostipes sp.]
MCIFCIGQSAYDIIIPMTEPIVENRKYRITEQFECGGGPALNASFLIAKWGAPVQLISRIGDDEYGERIKKVLEEQKVGLDYLIPDKKIKTPYSFIFSNKGNGSRTLFNFPGELEEVVFSMPEENVDVILSDGHEPEITLQAVKKYKNAVSIIDAGTYRESTYKVAKEVDYIVCSEDFAKQYTGKVINLQNSESYEKIFKEVEKINHKNVVITLGSRGLLYRQDGKIKHFPAYEVNTVDTNGAGDVFHGAFAYGVYKKMKLIDILKISSMAAAISTESLGAQTSIPKLQTVIDSINS